MTKANFAIVHRQLPIATLSVDRYPGNFYWPVRYQRNRGFPGGIDGLLFARRAEVGRSGIFRTAKKKRIL